MQGGLKYSHLEYIITKPRVVTDHRKRYNMNLLKTHEEILERLTELASKEKAFEERGQFRNIQKMIYEELEIIEKLKELKVSDNIELIDKAPRQG